MKPLVVLFDIDGTLVSCDGAGRRAMDAAFAEVTGDAEALAAIQFAGMTDRSIVRAGLRARRAAGRGGGLDGSAEDDATIDAVLMRYLSVLPSILAEQVPRVLAGAPALVDLLLRRDNAVVGLGTGNLAAGARHKLGAVGLWDRFSFGGFGSDREERPALLEVGAQRGAAQLGVDRRAAEVVVIGDTPADIGAARAIGARCLAVSTPRFTVAALDDAGADHSVESLSDPAAAAFFGEG